MNGGISVNFPNHDSRRHQEPTLMTDLNGTGPTIHAETTNGGVQIERAGGTESAPA